MQLRDLLQITQDLQPHYQILAPSRRPIVKLQLGRQHCLLLVQSGKALTIAKLQQILKDVKSLTIEAVIVDQKQVEPFYAIQIDQKQQAIILR